MFRSLAAALCLLALPAAAQDRPDIAASLRDSGLAPTGAMLAALPDPDPTERFALGGVRFLRAIETTLQTRWRLGINAARSELPILRLPVPPNPAPEPFTPEVIEALFAGLVADLATARAPLLTIGDDDAVSLPLALDDLWFDINMNGVRDTGEALANVAGLALTGRGLDGGTGAVIVFDTADAAWLAAYTHFLSGFAELVRAFDPTGPIAEVAAASAKMELLAEDTPFRNAMDMQFGQQVDRLMMAWLALKQQPDPAHTRAARAHLLEMIVLNRLFWDRVATETDDEGEWIPNDSQRQALGLTVPPGTGERWQAVLDDAEALLNGERLIPFWRMRSGAGLNMRKMLEHPVPVDLAGWLHGIGLLEFAEEGETVSRDAWLDFRRLVRGDEWMFVIFLN